MFLFYGLHCVYTKYMFARGAPWFIGGKMYWNLISIFSLTAAPTMWYWKCIFLCAPSTSCETCKEMPIQSMNNHEMKHPISIPLISNSSPYICSWTNLVMSWYLKSSSRLSFSSFYCPICIWSPLDIFSTICGKTFARKKFVKISPACSTPSPSQRPTDPPTLFFSCPGSSIPDLGEWVTDRHFRILTQIVTFETWDP